RPAPPPGLRAARARAARGRRRRRDAVPRRRAPLRVRVALAPLRCRGPRARARAVGRGRRDAREHARHRPVDRADRVPGPQPRTRGPLTGPPPAVDHPTLADTHAGPAPGPTKGKIGRASCRDTVLSSKYSVAMQINTPVWSPIP